MSASWVAVGYRTGAIGKGQHQAGPERVHYHVERWNRVNARCRTDEPERGAEHVAGRVDGSCHVPVGCPIADGVRVVSGV